MQVERLALRRFRSYEAAELTFSPDTNVIWGDNAQGKTNLLEAISWLTAAKSFRTRRDGELIAFGADRAMVEADVLSRDREFHIEAAVRPGVRRSVTVNGVKKKTAAELSGILNAVVFCPGDLELIQAGSAVRRRFLDDAICQLYPRYAAALAEYNRLREHKTRILRDWEGRPALLDTLDDFSLRMAAAGAVLVRTRAAFLEKLQGFAAGFHRDCSGGKETLTLRYETKAEDPAADGPAVARMLYAHMAAHRRAEIESRSCLSGPHRDDIAVSVDGREAKAYASQGQVRTAAVALKLGEWEMHRTVLGERPVLLLDDVLSELDEARQSFLRERITGGQVFITCCTPPQGPVNGRRFRVEKGSVTEE